MTRLSPPSQEHTEEQAGDARDSTFAGLASWLSGGIVVVTGLLTAVGGYTGGASRILRNDPWTLVGSATAVFLAVVLALVAVGITRHTHLWKIEGNAIFVLRLTMLAMSVALFLAALLVSLWAATASVSDTADRPSLSAQLITNPVGKWSLKGQAGTSGLASDDHMQVLVYGMLPGSGDPRRIFYATTGPDADGVASESFEVPLPDSEFEVIVVTTSNGILPRDCSAKRAFYAEAAPAELRQVPSGKFEPEVPSTCLTFAPPG